MDVRYADAHKHLCLEYSILEQWDKAVTACTSALSVHPDDSTSQNGLRYANRGKASEAWIQAPALINLGLKYYNEDNWAQAIKVWSQIPPQSPQFATARSNLASALIMTKDFVGARSLIDEALRLDPKNELFQNNARWLETEAAKAH